MLSSPLFYVTAGFAFASRLVDAAGDAFAGAAVVALAAAPIVLLTAVAETGAGDGLAERAARDRAAYESERPAFDAAVAAAKAGRPDAFGPGRRTLLPTTPSHLRGELAGDYGLDPLGLAREGGPCEALVRFAPFDPRGEEARKGVLQRLCELELLHARWAMLAVPGAALPEALQRALGVDLGGEGAVWWRVGAAKAAGASLNYFGIEGFRVAGGTGILTIAVRARRGAPRARRRCRVAWPSLTPFRTHAPTNKQTNSNTKARPARADGRARVRAVLRHRGGAWCARALLPGARALASPRAPRPADPASYPPVPPPRPIAHPTTKKNAPHNALSTPSRSQLEPVGVFLPGDPNYPGGAVFDPFGFADDADAFVENQLSEIAWGRAAMVAFVGIAAQAAATRKGPVENLLDFAADPAHNNALALLAE